MTVSPFALRPLRLSDAPLILQARNAPHVREAMLTQHRITLQEHTRWMQQRIKNLATRPYFIFEWQNTPIGLIGMSSYENNEGQWGGYLWIENAPKGTGTHMVSAFLDEMFLRRGLRNMHSLVLPKNSKSLHLHTKLGFTQGPATQEALSFILPRKTWLETRTKFIPYIEQVAFSGNETHE